MLNSSVKRVNLEPVRWHKFIRNSVIFQQDGQRYRKPDLFFISSDNFVPARDNKQGLLTADTMTPYLLHGVKPDSRGIQIEHDSLPDNVEK